MLEGKLHAGEYVISKATIEKIFGKWAAEHWVEFLRGEREDG